MVPWGRCSKTRELKSVNDSCEDYIAKDEEARIENRNW